MENNVFDYIKSEEQNWRTVRIPITGSKDWNMSEHIERCTNVANAWFHQGQNDGKRPYDDIVTPILNVAFRSEGFDVKDIVPFVDNADDYHKSFLIKKYHPKWAKKNELDTFIDDVVETSVIYDLVLIKESGSAKPTVVDLKTLAFCDQTDVLAGPICIKHNYTPEQINEYRGKWDDSAIDICISNATYDKSNNITKDQKAKTPTKYCEVYELRGNLPKKWIDSEAKPNEYENQLHIVAYYKDDIGNNVGLSLFKGIDKPLKDRFKALKIDRIRSKGRACGRSIVESLFEPQVWNNYGAIKLKRMLDAAVTVFQSDSAELANQKLTDIKENTILKHEPGKPISRVDGNMQNITFVQNYQTRQENNARVIGSASDAQLGTNPVSGTPFALQNLVVQQGQGIHEYRQGKIASFFSDILYPEIILPYMVKDLENGKTFSDILSLEEVNDIANIIVRNNVQNNIKKEVLKTGNVPTKQEMEDKINVLKDDFVKKGNRQFFEIIKGELKNIPLDVMVNIAGKQKYMAQNADKITNIIREVVKNPEVFAKIPGVAKAFNELLENSGMSAIDFSKVTLAESTQSQQQEQQAVPVQA